MNTSASQAPNRARSSCRRSIAERRRIVELTFHEGASVSEIAIAHGIHPTSLSHWRSLYCRGELTEDSSKNLSPVVAPTAAFLPVDISPESPRAGGPTVAHSVVSTRERNIVQITLSSGATLRMETSTLDAGFVCALLAEVR
jgi:transposase-like protein